MTRSLSAAALSLAMLAVAIHPSHGDETLSTLAPAAHRNQDAPDWGLRFAPVPDVLRAHCHSLRGGIGLLVDQVSAASAAAQMGLKSDDVILRVAGQPLTSVDELPPPGEVIELSLLREGRVRRIELMPPGSTAGGVPIQGFAPPQWPMGGKRFPRMPQSPGPAPWGATAMSRGSGYSQGYAATASATSIAGGNQSVSISQAGDQITLEIFDPRLDDKPIRFRGTRPQIEQQLRQSDLTETAQQRVLRTLGRSH